MYWYGNGRCRQQWWYSLDPSVWCDRAGDGWEDAAVRVIQQGTSLGYAALLAKPSALLRHALHLPDSFSWITATSPLLPNVFVKFLFVFAVYTLFPSRSRHNAEMYVLSASFHERVDRSLILPRFRRRMGRRGTNVVSPCFPNSYRWKEQNIAHNALSHSSSMAPIWSVFLSGDGSIGHEQNYNCRVDFPTRRPSRHNTPRSFIAGHRIRCSAV